MLSINTNLAGLIAQNSMKTSTDKLNQAIERMTTGFKINHASNNAANYSISTNLTTQLSAYDAAADNVAMGMDLVSYASDIISQMQDKAARLNALSTQARNGTYGAQSLSALNSEANAIMSELMRLYSTAEYNDISLFNRTAYTIAPHLPQAGASGFIDETALVSPTAGTTTDAPTAKAEYNGFIVDPKHPNGDAYVDGLTSVTEAIAAGSLTSGGEYKVGGVDDLKALATYVNSGNNTSGMTFIMSEDIDLSGEGNWTPIGDYSTSSAIFKGIFDGNGHVIKNLKIDRETSDYQGLFGNSNTATLKNVGIINANIKGRQEVGILSGENGRGYIINCYVTGNVTGTNYLGGLASIVRECSNSYAVVDVTGTGSYVGGLAGTVGSTISNSYATGNVSGTGYVGGLVGQSSSVIENSYATGDVSGTGNYVGGLAGNSFSISNSYATGTVNGSDRVGGLAGYSCTISNSYATGAVSGTEYVGGLVGYNAEGEYEIGNSYCTGDVKGNDYVGGLVGYWNTVSYRPTTVDIENSVCYSKVNGNTNVATLANINSSGQLSISLNNVKLIEQDGVEAVTTTTAYDLSTVLAAISNVAITNTSTTLQVGIYSNSSSQINFDTNFSFDLNIDAGIESVEAFDAIVAFENLLSEKATQLGAVQNRLESALESIEVNINNLTSSRSTIRDADIAEVSSEYIRQQILQQASATLMATANQSPAIALQLI